MHKPTWFATSFRGSSVYFVGRTAGFGPRGLCAERAVGRDPFAVLLADDFLTDYEPGVTADLVQAFSNSGISQL